MAVMWFLSCTHLHGRPPLHVLQVLRRVDRGMVHVTRGGSVRMHACELSQCIPHPALLITDAASGGAHTAYSILLVTTTDYYW